MEHKFEDVREFDTGGHKMWHRLNWAVGMIEKITSKKFDELPMELKVETLKIGTSMFIQSEKR